MTSKVSGPYSDMDLEMRNIFLRWFRLSNEIMSKSFRMSQPLLYTYVKALSNMMPTYEDSYQKSCHIPETQCPAYCVGQMEWDASEGDTVTGSLEIHNAGKKAQSFELTADTFRSSQYNSSVKPQLNPSSFSLSPGEKKNVIVSFNVTNSLTSNESYKSEVKIAGRYEQCVILFLNIKEKCKPFCTITHGEIPTRIVAHHWYDHFQCEELCFEPISPSTSKGRQDLEVELIKADVKEKQKKKK